VDAHQKNIVIVGATSAIAVFCAREFAKHHCRFLLVGRSQERLAQVEKDLLARGAESVTLKVVAFTDDGFAGIISDYAKTIFPTIDAVILAHGDLGDHARALEDPQYCAELIATNFLTFTQLMIRFSHIFKKQKFGTIAVFSSVAGDRGRRSNFIYGSAKAGLTAFASGLRSHLFDQGVHVLTIKPGMVDTPMTVAFKKGLLFASAEAVGKGAFQAICADKNEVYLPKFWRVVMLVIKLIPEPLFKRLSL
jgi:short-subunit dehydrogenase